MTVRNRTVITDLAGCRTMGSSASTRRPLLAVGHGSRVPASAAMLRVLVANVAARLPDVDVRLGFIELSDPLLTDVLPELDDPVVVPLLLSRGTHVFRDLPAEAAAPLGPDPVLTEVLLDRIAEAGIAPSTPLVLAGTGSATPEGQQDVRSQAAMLAEHWPAGVTAAFVTAAHPTVGEATASVRAVHGVEPAVVSYFLAPGLLPDAAKAATRPLGDHPAVADLVLARYQQVLPVG
jgi:sirohydrochlorin ferrochelatase